jgi:predicted metal-dependent hydrolase
MNQIEVNGLQVDVVRKDIKNLHLGVYPPNGRVRVAVPLRLNDDAVRLAVITRLPWIKRQQLKFQEQERQTAREYVNGESHYFQGERYRLNIIEQPGRETVAVRNKQFIDLYVRPGSDAAHRQRVISGWYRTHLRQYIPPLIEKWQPILGVEVAEWGIKQMKTKWGTCNIAARRIWLNLELAKKPERCLEYIVVHEMVHLLERQHNERFLELMNQFLPQWRLYRDELNSFPLAHDEWGY